MNRIIIITAVIILLVSQSCKKGESNEQSVYDCQFNFADSSTANHHAVQYQTLLDGITSQGVTGIMMSVYRPQTGLWVGASGKADLFNDVDMKACNITRVGSTVKMFTAVTVLKLAEEGKLRLDDKISDYLQGDMITKIENVDVATIRQLLQHSSGIYNYIQNLEFQTASTNNLIREWHAEDLLKYAYHKSAYFKPGEDVGYSNTNYILLGLLIEKIEGKPFYKVFEEKLFGPLGLHITRFAAENPVPSDIVRGYIDLYSNLQVIESTYYSGWDYYCADGGLLSNPYDLCLFFRALMRGQIMNAASMSEMLSWKQAKTPDTEFFPLWYGLGIFRMETPQGMVYFHSGDAIGYYANMMYLPADSSMIAYAVNSNYGKIDQFVSTKDAMGNILATVMQ